MDKGSRYIVPCFGSLVTPVWTMKLSVAIPVFNEIGTLPRILRLVASALPTVPKQIILVNDGSRDGTAEWLVSRLPTDNGSYRLAAATTNELEFEPATDHGGGVCAFLVLHHDSNLGKGAAIRIGFHRVEGDIVVIQDADLEYDPADWSIMYDLIANRRIADVVHGSRFHGRPHRSLNFHHYLGNRIISLAFNLLYNQTPTDIEVCYKMPSCAVLESLWLIADDLGIEISAQIARQKRWWIYEVGISYSGRTHDEGEMITWRDGLEALLYVIRYRF